MIVRYDDHEEVIEAGAAFYMPPGHAPEAEAGTETVQFSPAEKLASVVDAIKPASPARREDGGRDVRGDRKGPAKGRTRTRGAGDDRRAAATSASITTASW
jgi:hypothetical protein